MEDHDEYDFKTAASISHAAGGDNVHTVLKVPRSSEAASDPKKFGKTAEQFFVQLKSDLDGVFAETHPESHHLNDMTLDHGSA